MSTGWRLFWARKWICIVGTFAVMVLYVGAVMVCSVGSMMLAGFLPVPFNVGLAIMSLAGNLMGLVLQALLFPGLLVFFLAVARGESAMLADLFSGPAYFLRVFPALLWFTLITSGPVLAFQFVQQTYAGQPEVVVPVVIAMGLWVIPMMILALIYAQYLFLIVDRASGVRAAFRLSREITQGNRVRLFLLYLTMGVIYLTAMIPLIVGIALMGAAAGAGGGNAAPVLTIFGVVLLLAGLPMLAAAVVVVAPWLGLSFTVAYLRMSGQPVVNLSGRIESPLPPSAAL